MAQVATKSNPRAPQIYTDIVQGSPEWFELRLGIPTASNFKYVMATGSVEMKGRTTYMRKLAGEIITGELASSYKNERMELGNILEPELLKAYEFELDVKDGPVQRIGFAKNHAAGCSPDGLVGANGAVEFKSAEPHVLIGYLEKPDHFPPEHKWQCDGALWILEREWIDIRIGWPKMKPFTYRRYRNEADIRLLRGGIAAFNEELAKLVERMRP